jgi:A/G-specific adenine glycosylase
MLQQTQVERVIPKWQAFLRAYPSPQSLASAPLSDVLVLWKGLGFPRRAKYLHDAAAVMVAAHRGRVPSSIDELRALPGVGEYTARAVASFAFGAPVGVLDTNVGRILARALVNRPLRPREAYVLVDELVTGTDVPVFNQALLDLGAQFCKSVPRCDICPLASACRFHREGGADPATTSAAVSRPQSRFAGSARQARGRVMARLIEGPASPAQIFELIGTRADEIVLSLLDDGLIERRGRQLRLAGHRAR